MSSRKVSPPSWDELISLWLHGRPQSTQEIYRPVVQDFRLWFKGRPISKVQLEVLHQYEDAWGQQQPRTVQRKISTIKSFLGFLERTGKIKVNPARAWRLPKVPNDLAQRILPESSVQSMMSAPEKERDRILVKVLYSSGIRASEAAGLDKRNLQPRGNAGQIVVTGKGNKTRSILLPAAVWKSLLKILPEDAEPNCPVFRNKDGSRMSRTHITTIVSRAAQSAGIAGNVSAHWLRHAHATHSIENGAPLSLVQQTLGHNNVATTSRYLHARPDKSSSKFIKA